MSKTLTKEQLQDIAAEFGIDVPMIKALIDCFGLPTGFSDSTGDVVIHFEPYYFHRYTGVRVDGLTGSQAVQKKAYDNAYGLNPRVAQLSTYWGCLQLQGRLHVLAGYNSPAELIDSFSESEYNQVRGFMRYVKSTENSHINLFEPLVNKDFASFASLHAGPYYKRQELHSKFKECYFRHKRLM